jgi:hypothetical protein
MSATMSVTETIALLGRLDVIGEVLKLIGALTKMRIVLIARIRDGTWTCMAVLDEAGFGLKPGDALPLETTY